MTQPCPARASACSAADTPSVVFDDQIKELLDRTERVFRINANVVGVADPEVLAAAIAARGVLPTERSVFKPAAGLVVDDELANRVIHALGRDIAQSHDMPLPGLAGAWPLHGRTVLRHLLFPADEAPFTLLAAQHGFGARARAVAADALTALWPADSRAAAGRSALSGLFEGTHGVTERRRAAALYRRAGAVLADGVSALVTNAAWAVLRVPDRTDEIQWDEVLWETLRLLPPAWMLWRDGGPEYAALHPLIGPGDAVALFPLLMHRDPELWNAPAAFQPQRWRSVDPARTPGFVPFGLAPARCWARHLILPLAERLLRGIVDQGLRPHVPAGVAPVPLRSLLSARINLIPEPDRALGL